MRLSVSIFILFYALVSCNEVNPEPEKKQAGPTALFLELWDKFDRNYAFFELRNIDWNGEKAHFLINTQSIDNDSLLFERICSLLQKFDDTHINLESESLGLSCNAGKLPHFLREFPSNQAFNAFLKARNNTLNKVGINTLIDSPSNIFQYGWSEDQEWGYLRIKRFYGASRQAIELELNSIQQNLKLVKNLMLDIRTNPGGNDETALLCAGYYFKQKEIAFIKKVRKGLDYESFSQPDTTYVLPNYTIQTEHDKIYLLTNGASGSSADVFALVMSYLPNLRVIGEHTEGIFSNMYRDTLSNGWRFTLSNERYYSKDMVCYEKIGVPVDQKITNEMEDVMQGIDLVIQTIIE